MQSNLITQCGFLLIASLFLCSCGGGKSGNHTGVTKKEGYYDQIGESASDGMIVVKKNNKYGFVNRRGEEVIPLAYDEAWSFQEGFAPVKKGKLWGYVDTVGKLVIDCQYNFISRFENGYAIVRKQKMYGVINKKGTAVIPFRDRIIDEVSEGIAKLRSTDGIKYGFVDIHGMEIAPCVYVIAHPFQNGMAMVARDGNFGYVDRSGKEILIKGSTNADDFNGDLANVQMDYKFYGCVNKKGKWAIPCIYSNLQFSENRIIIEDNDHKFGMIDRTGKIITPPKYRTMESFHKGFAQIQLSYEPYNSFGIIDTTGAEIVKTIYKGVDTFSEGLASVQMADELYGFVNTQGLMVISPAYCYVITGMVFKNGYALVDSDTSLRGNQPVLIDKAGKRLSLPNHIFPLSGLSDLGLIKAKSKGKYGFVDVKGRVIIPFEYDSAEDFNDGLVLVTKNGKPGYLNSTGQFVVGF